MKPLTLMLVGTAAAAVLLGGAGGWYWLYGPCGVKPVAKAHADLAAMQERWDDALKVANVTPMLAIAGPMAKLQDLKRETAAMQVPACAEHARNLLALQMGTSIDAVMTFLAASPEQREVLKQNNWGGKIRDQAAEAKAELAHIDACAPRCDWVVWGR